MPTLDTGHNAKRLSVNMRLKLTSKEKDTVTIVEDSSQSMRRKLPHEYWTYRRGIEMESTLPVYMVIIGY
jgi:hypothetical protein